MFILIPSPEIAALKIIPMTLTEYLNQQDPQANCCVILKDNEYTIEGRFWNGKAYWTYVYIEAIALKFGYLNQSIGHYVQEGAGLQLNCVNSAVKKSCFHLPAINLKKY